MDEGLWEDGLYVAEARLLAAETMTMKLRPLAVEKVAVRHGCVLICLQKTAPELNPIEKCGA